MTPKTLLVLSGYVATWLTSYGQGLTLRDVAFIAVGTHASSGGGSADYRTTVLSNSPAIYYRLDDYDAGILTVTDSSGNGHTGSYNPDNTCLALEPSGAVSGNDALSYICFFPFYTGYIAVGPDAAATPGASPFSLEIWLKRSGPPGDIQVLIGKYDGGSDSYLLGVDSSGVAVFSVNLAASVIYGTTDITDGAWHHVVAVKNGTDLKLYVDGASDGTPVAFSGAVSPGDVCGIGTFGGTNGNYLTQSEVDEAAIYMSALSASDILGHYNAR